MGEVPAYNTTTSLGIAAELRQGLNKTAQFACHLCALARRVLSASHSRVGGIDARSASLAA